MIQTIILFNPAFRFIRYAQFFMAGLIFAYFALSPSPDTVVKSSPVILHFIGNMLLIMSAWVAFLHRMALWKTLLIAIPYSILIELAQGMTKTRQVELFDIGINLLGIAAGFALCYPINCWLQRAR